MLLLLDLVEISERLSLLKPTKQINSGKWIDRSRPQYSFVLEWLIFGSGVAASNFRSHTLILTHQTGVCTHNFANMKLFSKSSWHRYYSSHKLFCDVRIVSLTTAHTLCYLHSDWMLVHACYTVSLTVQPDEPVTHLHSEHISDQHFLFHF